MMKRMMVILLLLAALLPASGCQRVKAADIPPKELAERVTAALREETSFTAADEDYIESNLAGLSGRGVVFFGNDDDICEFGIFSLTDIDKNAAKSAIRTYIAAETEALSSMAQLYPSDEMQERLACYRNAYIGEGSGYIYYLIMEADEAATARTALNEALKA